MMWSFREHPHTDKVFIHSNDTLVLELDNVDQNSLRGEAGSTHTLIMVLKTRRDNDNSSFEDFPTVRIRYTKRTSNGT